MELHSVSKDLRSAQIRAIVIDSKGKRRLIEYRCFKKDNPHEVPEGWLAGIQGECEYQEGREGAPVTRVDDLPIT